MSPDIARLAGTLALVTAIARPDAAAVGATTAAGFILLPAASLAPRLAPGAVIDPDPAEAIRNRAARALPLPEAALMTSPAAGELCAQGLLQPVGTAGTCSIPATDDALLLLSGGDTEPHWRDLWDIARRPGRRGLPREAVGVLEIALLADGVAPGSVYRTLGTADGAARAFRKLDQLRPYIAWWTDGAEARHALRSGAVMMAVVPADELGPPADRVAAAFRAGDALSLPLVWTQPAPTDRGTKPEAGVPPTAGDARLATLAGETPPVTRPASTLDPTLAIDGSFWRDHQDLRARFRVWLGA